MSGVLRKVAQELPVWMGYLYIYLLEQTYFGFLLMLPRMPFTACLVGGFRRDWLEVLGGIGSLEG